MKSFILKNFIVIFSFSFSLFGVHVSEAQTSNSISNINLDFEGKTISGEVSQFLSSSETEVYLTTLNGTSWDQSIPNSMLIGVIFDGARSFSFEFDTSAGSNTLRPELATTTYANIAADNNQEIANYADIIFKNDNASAGYFSYSLRDLINSTGATNSVVINWGDITLQNDPVTNLFYHDITSDGFARREKNEPVYLNITKSAIGRQSQHFTLCRFDETGREFLVSFPLCAGAGQLNESPIEPGFDYKLFFSNQPNSSFVINGSGGDGVINLPRVPDVDNTSNLPVTITSRSVKNASGKAYYEIQGTVNSTNLDSDEKIAFMVREKGTNNTPILLGEVPFVDIGNTFRVPSVSELANIPSLRPAEYELLIMRFGQPLQGNIDLPPITASTDSGNSTDSNDTFYNATQETIIREGIVGSIDCGYNLGKDENGKPKGGRLCGFSDFIILIQRIIEYVFVLVLPIMAIVFAYAGYLLLTSGGSESKRTAAKKAMTSALIGVVVIMSAWLLVKTVLVSLGVPQGADWFFLSL